MKPFMQACSFYEQLMHYMQQFVEEWFYEQFIHIYSTCIPWKKALFIWLSACYCYKNVLILIFLKLFCTK